MDAQLPKWFSFILLGRSIRGTGKAEAMAKRATRLSEAALETWARSLGTGVAATLELEAWARSLETGVSVAL
jgi:hypothetical protein